MAASAANVRFTKGSRRAVIVGPTDQRFFPLQVWMRQSGVLRYGMVERLRQRVFAKSIVWVALISLLTGQETPCRCGEHAPARGSVQRTGEQRIRPNCCGDRNRAVADRPSSCCRIRTKPGDVDSCRHGRESSRTTDCRLHTVSAAKHTGGCNCGQDCECGSNSPSTAPATPASSLQRATDKVTVGHAVTPMTAFCHAPAVCSTDGAFLIPRAASCGLSVQFCHLTI